MSDEIVRIGVIGGGAFFRHVHMPALRQIPKIDLIAVCNRTEASTQEIAQACGIREVESSWERLVHREDLDAVMIGTWPDTHAAISLASLDAGKHVLCQSPLARDLHEVKAVAAAARRHADLVSMVCPSQMQFPHGRYVKRTIASGRIGAVTVVDVISTSSAAVASTTADWRERREVNGQDVLTVGPYAETLNSWVGPYRWVTAALTTPIPVKQDHVGGECRIDLPQVVMLLGVLENGAAGVEYHGSVTVDGVTARNLVTIYGLEGTLRYNFATRTLQIGRPGGDLETIDVPASEVVAWRAENDFVEAVRAAKAGRRPSYGTMHSFDDCVAFFQKLEAMYQSASGRRAIFPAEL